MYQCFLCRYLQIKFHYTGDISIINYNINIIKMWLKTSFLKFLLKSTSLIFKLKKIIIISSSEFIIKNWPNPLKKSMYLSYLLHICRYRRILNLFLGTLFQSKVN